MIVHHLMRYLDDAGIKYDIISHTPTATTQETAHVMHVSGWTVAKAVVIREGRLLSMVVLPAPAKIDFVALRDLLNARSVELATEADFEDMFPDCELGAMPPFGNLYGMKVYVDVSLLDDEMIYFNAGSHTDLIRMRYDDWEMLVEPEVLDLAQHAMP